MSFWRHRGFSRAPCRLFSAVQGELELFLFGNGQLDALQLLLIIDAFPLCIGQFAVFLQKRFQIVADLVAVKRRVLLQFIGSKCFQHGLAEPDKKRAVLVLLASARLFFKLFPQQRKHRSGAGFGVLLPAEPLGKLFLFRAEPHPDGGLCRFVKVLEKLVDQCRRGVAAGTLLLFVRLKDLIILKQDIVGMAAQGQPLFVSGKILQNLLKLRKQHPAPP